jgi:uncharacterized membrane protein
MRPPAPPWFALTLVLCLVVSSDWATSETAPPTAESDAKVEPVEEVEAVEMVDAIETTDGSARSVSLAQQIIGRNHPALVHVPIGFILAVCLLEFLALCFPKIELGQATFILCLATVASFIPASLTGWLRAGELFASRQAPDLLFEHRNLIIAACAIFTVSVLLRVFRKDKLQGMAKTVYLGLLLLSMVLIGLGGHHGGQLVYGEDFLPY